MDWRKERAWEARIEPETARIGEEVLYARFHSWMLAREESCSRVEVSRVEEIVLVLERVVFCSRERERRS